MSDALVTLLAGLGGALIGALAAIGAQALANRHSRTVDRRHEVVDLVARLWDSADRLWRASEGLEIAVFSMMNAEAGDNPEAARIYGKRREESLASQHAAETQGLFLVAQMRLLYPSVADPAQALLEASSNFNLKHRDDLRAKRQAALEAYENAARSLLDRAG